LEFEVGLAVRATRVDWAEKARIAMPKLNRYRM
jgi:hypothetical protein